MVVRYALIVLIDTGKTAVGCTKQIMGDFILGSDSTSFRGVSSSEYILVKCLEYRHICSEASPIALERCVHIVRPEYVLNIREIEAQFDFISLRSSLGL